MSSRLVPSRSTPSTRDFFPSAGLRPYNRGDAVRNSSSTSLSFTSLPNSVGPPSVSTRPSPSERRRSRRCGRGTTRGSSTTTRAPAGSAPRSFPSPARVVAISAFLRAGCVVSSFPDAETTTSKGRGRSPRCFLRSTNASATHPGVCPSPPGECCTYDGACADGQRCVQPANVCQSVGALEPGQCWSEHDCPNGPGKHFCAQPTICACGSDCPTPERMVTERGGLRRVGVVMDQSSGSRPPTRLHDVLVGKRNRRDAG